MEDASTNITNEAVENESTTKTATTEFEEFDFSYSVYVKTNGDGVITEVNSSAFILDTTGWVYIDEGIGDKYHHAQGNYLSVGLTDENGIFNYKLTDGKPELRTTEEKTPELEHIATAQEISELKAKLTETDYIAAKIAEGAATREEYAEELSERAAWRARINELESIERRVL